MFLKERKKPIPLKKLDAIISRLPPQHPKLPILRKQAASYQKGFNGERKLDYHLRGMPDHFCIINDVTLTVFKKNVQIDSFIITPSGIYIIEVKSMDGTVTFDTTTKQLIQSNGEKKNGYKYPITQTENIQFHLLRWLEKRKLSGIPIYYFVVFSEQSTIINVKGDEEAVRKVVSYVDEIPVRLIKFDNFLAGNRSGNTELQHKVIRTILSETVDFDYDVLRRFGVERSEILSGVHCPECNKLSMERRNYKWHCYRCDSSSKDAHKKALQHYTLLINDELNNLDCKDFLLLKSRFVTRKILKTSQFELITGTKRWKVRK